MAFCEDNMVDSEFLVDDHLNLWDVYRSLEEMSVFVCILEFIRKLKANMQYSIQWNDKLNKTFIIEGMHFLNVNRNGITEKALVLLLLP